MKIHGLVYLIVGAFLIGFSYYVSNVNQKIDLQKFMLFIWAGGVFAAIGLFKLIVGYFSNKKNSLEGNGLAHRDKRAMHHHKQQHAASHHQAQHNQPQQTGQFVKFCSNCGTAVRHFDNFCYKCGNRMFHRK